MSKYRAKPTTVDNIRFSSKREANRYCSLKILQNAHKISELRLQPSYDITINGTHICKVKLDFEYMCDGNKITEDSKGYDNPLSQLKRKLVEAQHGIEVLLV